MNDIYFVMGLGGLLVAFLAWAFRHLPNERWQMLAVVPTIKNQENHWRGTNLTYYGFFIATSQLLALALLLMLLGAMHASLVGAGLIIAIILVICIPAARFVAFLVEKKRHTFTIGGASFLGFLIAPWVVILVQKLLMSKGCFLPTIPVLAALSIAYTFGEGIGRLGCISFGCCYGKPVQECNRFLQLIFAKMHFVFSGTTKKAAYEGKLVGVRLVPVQAITCVIYSSAALIGTLFFLAGQFRTALLLTVLATQLWRILSETLRADFRGYGLISAYQKMGIISILYMVVIALTIPAPQYIFPNILLGLKSLWNPTIILSAQILWLLFFLIFGRSTVTTSTVSFELIHKHI